MIPPPLPTPQPVTSTATAKTRFDPRPNGYRNEDAGHFARRHLDARSLRYGVFVVVPVPVVLFTGALRSTNVAISAATFVLKVAACTAVSLLSATALSIHVFAAVVSACTRPSRLLPWSFAMSPRLLPLRIAVATSLSVTPPR